MKPRIALLAGSFSAEARDAVGLSQVCDLGHIAWLEASTRAYARIIDELNKLPLSALQRPPEGS